MIDILSPGLSQCHADEEHTTIKWARIIVRPFYGAQCHHKTVHQAPPRATQDSHNGDFEGINESTSPFHGSNPEPSTQSSRDHEPLASGNAQEPQDIKNDDFKDTLTHFPAQSSHSMQLRPGNNIAYSAGAELLPGTQLSTSLQKELGTYYDRFKSKEFLLHQAQGLPTHVMHNSYFEKENTFVQSSQKVHKSKIPQSANVIGSHVLYKIKELDDGRKLCKSRIAPHGNRDNEKGNLKTDSALCPPLGMRVLLSVCTILQFYVFKVDVKSAFLQSGNATRDVYVRPPREYANRDFYWLLDVATYGIVNANAKWEKHSDTTLLALGLSAVIHIPQLFYLGEEGILVLLVAKIVDDFLIEGERDRAKESIAKLEQIYKLGTIIRMPGTFRFFGLVIEQDKDYAISISRDSKLLSIQPYNLGRVRRKDPTTKLNALELFSFQSVNGLLRFFGMTVSPFSAFGASYLQQTAQPTVHDLVQQRNHLKLIQQLESVSCFKRPPLHGSHEIAVLLFSDAGRPSHHGQLGYIRGILIGDLRLGFILHTVSWMSHLSKRPVKSIGSAEVLAAGEAIDQVKLIADT